MYTVEWMTSRKGKNPVAIYRIPDSDEVYEFFLKQKLSGDVDIYVCCGCDSIRSRNNREGVKNVLRVPAIKVIGGVFQSDPCAPLNPHFCVARSSEDVIVSRAVDEVVLKMREEEERTLPEEDETRTYPAEWMTSRKGKNPVALYRIPDSDEVYEFFLKKKLSGDGGIYVCCGCDSIRSKNNREGVSNLCRVPVVKIIGGLFQSDPCVPRSPHFCVAKSSGAVIASRAVDEVVLKMREEENRMAPKEASTRIVKHLLSSEKFNELPVFEKLVAVHTSTNGVSAAGKASMRRRLQRAHKSKDKMPSFLVVKLPPGTNPSDLINQAASESLLFTLCNQPTDVVKFIDDNSEGGSTSSSRAGKPSAEESKGVQQHPEIKTEPLDIIETGGLTALTPGHANLFDALNFPMIAVNSEVPNLLSPLPSTSQGETSTGPVTTDPFLSTLYGKRERVKQFKCPVCPMFLTSQGLACHLRSHPNLTLDYDLGTSEGKEVNYHCSKCPRGFENYQQLRIHTALHVKERPRKLSATESRGEEEVVAKKAKLEEPFGDAETDNKISEEFVIREGRVTFEEGPTTEAGNEAVEEEESAAVKAENIDNDNFEDDTDPDSMETFITLSSTSDDNEFVGDFTTMNASSTPQPQEIHEPSH